MRLIKTRLKKKRIFFQLSKRIYKRKIISKKAINRTTHKKTKTAKKKKEFYLYFLNF